MRRNSEFIFMLLAVALALAAGQHANAQKLYVNAGVGYGFGMEQDYYQQHHSTFIYEEDSTSSYALLTTEKFSFGKGLQVELGLGSFTGKHISFEITGFYHKSSPQTIKHSSYSSYYDSYEVDYSEETTITASMMGLKPSMVIWGGDHKIRPYMKAGVLFGFIRMSEEQKYRIFNTNPYYYPTEDIQAVFEFENRLSIGAAASAGLQVSVAEDVRIFAECSYSAVRYVPLAGEYTEYKYRGDDELGELTTSERYHEYVDEYDTRDNESENAPTQSLKRSYSFSKLSFLAGIRINLFY